MAAVLLALIGAPTVGVDGAWLTVDGRPTLLVGDSVTQGWMELGTDFDQLAYLDALAADGLNAVLIWSFIGAGDPTDDERIGYHPPTLWPWVRAGERFDLLTFNDAYFARLEAFCAAAGERGLVVVVTIHDGWTKTRFDGHPFNAALGGPLTDRRQYVTLAEPERELAGPYDPAWPRERRHQFLIERYVDRLAAAIGACPNVVFEVFNEGEWYDQADLAAFQRHTARMLRARCRRPVMINIDHARLPLRDAADIVSLHLPNWTPATPAREPFQRFTASLAQEPPRPLVFSEPVPEYRGDPAHHPALVRLAWGTLLAGGGFLLQNDVSFGFAPRASIASRGPHAAALRAALGHAARFLRGFDLRGLSPQPELASSGVCLADPQRLVLAWQPAGEALEVDLTGWAGDWWAERFEPFAGRRLALGPLPGGGRRTIAASDADGVVAARRR